MCSRHTCPGLRSDGWPGVRTVRQGLWGATLAAAAAAAAAATPEAWDARRGPLWLFCSCGRGALQGQEAPDCPASVVQAATLCSRCLREPGALCKGTDRVLEANSRWEGRCGGSPGLLRPVKWPAQQGSLHRATPAGPGSAARNRASIPAAWQRSAPPAACPQVARVPVLPCGGAVCARQLFSGAASVQALSGGLRRAGAADKAPTRRAAAQPPFLAAPPSGAVSGAQRLPSLLTAPPPPL